MNKNKSRKKPLIQWMDSGDPDLVPVFMAEFGSRFTAASYFGISPRKKGVTASFIETSESPITPEMVMKCTRETGIHVGVKLGYPTPFDAIEFMDGFELNVHDESYEGGVRRFTTIRTPQGELSDVFVTPDNTPPSWEEHFIKSENDVPAWLCFIETAAESVTNDPRVAKKVTARLSGEKQKWSDDSLLFASVGPAAFEMLSNLYIAPDMAFYILADHTSVMERMFEAQARTGEVWLRCAAEAGADFIISAINGLEIFSPTIYEKYLVPQTLRLTEATHALGMRFWVHNCGLMKKLIDMGVYERMGIDVLESFSNPPLGDVSDLRNARIKLGHKIVTRGALNVDLFYDNKLNRIKDRTKVVLEETRGYRHMIGDTNDSLPPYPRENILAVVDEVQKSGRMFRS